MADAPTPMDGKVTGSWLVHHTNKLQHFSGASGFDRILSAGKATKLLSALSATQQNVVDMPRVEVLATAANMTPFELQGALWALEQQQLLQRSVSGVEVFGVTSATVLQRGAEVFAALSPRPEELAAISLAEMASSEPLDKREATRWISDTYRMTSGATDDFLAQTERTRLIDWEKHDAGAIVYFNGNLFKGGDLKKVSAILSQLNATERSLMSEVEERLKKQGCLAVTEIEKVIGPQLFERLNSIGFFDVNLVSNPTESVSFATRPAAFGKYANGNVDEGLDLAKAFVSSLTYGITRRHPNHGRIRRIEDLLGRLLRGEWTAAATAIGEDYVALELRGVVELRKGPAYGHQMRLRKTDVGQMALQVLQSGDASDMPLLKEIPSAQVTGYTGPEETRTLVRKHQLPESQRVVRNMLEVLRTGGGR
ncbi:hypothetical protein [Rhizobium indigoferae]|uniref:Uncharacterized protein n=1 Tax=Rhizobium indigoferae TaxID=158891 RepID=A0ABZ0ZK14_9HYPH|nr:hypothetical protein [Rhizobium indigoferae]NNU57599.1 hypothetical protein [Rhizobium indigoferae]WQN39521.1 hypothetical protein U5G49_004725 [Rhizobium indigoferae]